MNRIHCAETRAHRKWSKWKFHRQISERAARATVCVCSEDRKINIYMCVHRIEEEIESVCVYETERALIIHEIYTN